MSDKYCPKCNAKLKENAAYCSGCGTDVAAVSVTCTKCGAKLRPGGAFCPKCGERSEAASDTSSSGEYRSVAVPFKPVQNIRQIESKASLIGTMTAAPLQSGEFTIPDRSQYILPTSGILSPFRAAFGGVTRIFSNLKNIRRAPLSAIAGIFMALLWIIFMIWNQSDKSNAFSGIMSFLTFAEGGSLGTPLNKIGGVFGKGLVISAFMNLFSGSLRRLPASFRSIFSKGCNIGLLLSGAGLSAAAYQLFAGYAGEYGAMVAVCGAAVSLNALGGGKGYLYNLVLSLTSRRTGGVRRSSNVRFKSALTGMTLGFTIAAVLSHFHYPAWIALSVAVVGNILALVIPDKGGAVV